MIRRERQILERNGFTVHQYKDGYVEFVDKDGMTYSYDSLDQTAVDGLEGFTDNPRLKEILSELKGVKNGKNRTNTFKGVA